MDENSTSFNPAFVRDCEKGDVRSLEARLKSGQCPNSYDGFGDSALLRAVENGSEEVVKLLIIRGADPDVRDKDYWTPLHEAAKNGHQKMVDLLIEAGADVNAVNDCFQTPLDLSRIRGQSDVERRLHKLGALSGKEVFREHFPQRELPGVRGAEREPDLER